MSVIKRDKSASSQDLVQAIEKFIPLLKNQGEDEACDDLKAAAEALRQAKAGSPEHGAAVAAILEAFEGDHELVSYTFQRKHAPGEWTEAEELSEASSRVLSLARRMKQ